jgi:hypothetical protein
MTQRKSTTWLGYAGWGVLGAMLLASCGRSNLDWAELYGQGGFGGSSSTTTTSSGPSTTTSSGPSTTTSSGPTTTTTTTGTTECSSPVECDDGDFCTTDDCVGGLCSYVLRDDDSDDHVATACGGDDCNDLNPNTFPGHPEVCTDADDNDCNGVADCFDPACFNAPTCGCQPSPGGEDCDNGQDDDCDTTVDCNDTNCIGTPACGCAPSEAGACDNGFDDDCDGNIDCDDSECFGAANCQCQSQNEDCSNDQDDDCDLLIDCADADCAGTFPCKCQPPGSAEVCGSGLDEDCDTLIDCADPECLVTPGCQNCTQELCTDGVDNNCDNQIDCADPACFFDPACSPTQEVCNNQLDDDNDGKIDCSDPDCANNPLCVLQQKNCLSPKLIPGTGTYTGDTTGNVSETKGFCGGDAGEAVFYFVLTDPSFVQLNSVGTSFDSTLYVRTGKCNSGKEIGCDDDSGGSWAASLTFSILYPGTYYVFLDGYTIDPQGGANEGPFVLNATIIPNPPEICGDGIENDGDHYVDCADSDCVAAPGCSCNAPVLSGPEFGAGACTDGIDNDCDGTFDCGDDDCSASDYYVTECCDGTDENGNGIPDDFNCRCASDLDCDAGTICYTHTAYACGIPCDSFFGDVCPFVAAGSYCNATTHQCEF